MKTKEQAREEWESIQKRKCDAESKWRQLVINWYHEEAREELIFFNETSGLKAGWGKRLHKALQNGYWYRFPGYWEMINDMRTPSSLREFIFDVALGEIKIDGISEGGKKAIRQAHEQFYGKPCVNIDADTGGVILSSSEVDYLVRSIRNMHWEIDKLRKNLNQIIKNKEFD